ncbi:helix-turn-helix transcriptional regulator [Brenneria goodwinii]|uniref:helix-turn-helix transcriptional regulator n=1 Tax=Brenneria goodwinii TaxID=1109412 RepID=UPI0036F297A8
MMKNLAQSAEEKSTTERHSNSTSPLPGTEAYEALPQYARHCPLPFRRTIRRQELRQIVPLSETTIYEMERRGEFPQRFNLTPRCVVWDLDEVEKWIETRKQAMLTTSARTAIKPDVRLRKTRPVRAGSHQK